MSVDVCVCTHNPRMEVLERAIRSLASQTARGFQVLMVDNASSPPVPEAVLAPLRAAGITARVVREGAPGVARARARAIEETRGGWILFVDDDNELSRNYVEEGLAFMGARGDVGCFGGKLLLPEGLEPPRWVKPFLPFLAIRDQGEEVITGCSQEWGAWEPPTAGAFVRREIAEEYLRKVGADARILQLGRKGRDGLASCEDSLMMRQAVHLGLSMAYTPRLVLHHHLDTARFRLPYLLRLMHAYGSSHVTLQLLVKGHVEVPHYYKQTSEFWRLARRVFREERKGSLWFGVALVAYHWSARSAHLEADGEGASGDRAPPAHPLSPRNN